jgi:broad specificity phosphatase PhoE
MSATVHVIRHGEVENPGKILYGRQPGWSLSKRGLEMAQTLGDWSKTLDLGALHVSPLQRAQETAAPIAAAHKISITTDERLIEAANVFEGKPFGVGDGVLRHPAAWKHLWNPWRPSWGEPYEEQITRMLAAVFAARKRECSLASVTSVHFDDDGLISGLTYSEPARHLLPKK